MRNVFSLCLIFLYTIISLFPIEVQAVALLKINGEEISLSEYISFLRRYDRYGDKSGEEVFQSFLRYKMKVADAKKRGFDKDDSFLSKLEYVKTYLNDKFHPLEKGELYSNDVMICMLTYYIPQDLGWEVFNCADSIMKNVHDTLLEKCTNTVEWVKIGKEYGLLYDDFGNDYVPLSFLLDELGNEVNQLSEGEISEPFSSPEGVHIVKLLSRKSYSSDTVVIDSLLSIIEEVILVNEWNKKINIHPERILDSDLKIYFQRNKIKYRWEFPHYKGVVIHCENKKTAKYIKKKLRKVPLYKWCETIDNLRKEKPELVISSENGLFQIGENAYVDKLVFKCGDFIPTQDYPYTFVMGKCLDYQPDCFTDVYDEVLQDYITYVEDEYFSDLERILRVEKYIDVLKTVNYDGSN